jgi:hypothetical protein
MSEDIKKEERCQCINSESIDVGDCDHKQTVCIQCLKRPYFFIVADMYANEDREIYPFTTRSTHE